MKKLLFYFLLIFLSIIYPQQSIAQDTTDAKIIQRLKECFLKNNEIWNADIPSEEFESKLWELYNEYCTNDFVNKAQMVYKYTQFDHDLLMDDQYSKSNVFKKTLLVVSSDRNKNEYLVSFQSELLNGKYELTMLYVSIVEEKGIVKIADSKWAEALYE